ncbi:hypothetical protein GCM10010326_59490 [Streptomyces xanthochromogenes]|uniref:Uncharacterized protein n=1 Tax=Streptomyces xanthochromogenes TaxID=67384 RepID=A0ABQ3AJL1_9ACTN|nr:hypothetical protein GCM10010326_59490 [Streptomyces xanthochromogenes]
MADRASFLRRVFFVEEVVELSVVRFFVVRFMLRSWRREGPVALGVPAAPAARYGGWARQPIG